MPASKSIVSSNPPEEGAEEDLLEPLPPPELLPPLLLPELELLLSPPVKPAVLAPDPPPPDCSVRAPAAGVRNKTHQTYHPDKRSTDSDQRPGTLTRVPLYGTITK